MNIKISTTLRELNKPTISIVVLSLLAILGIGGNRVYGLQLEDSLRFILCVFCVFYVPGNLLLSYSSIKNLPNGGRFFLSLGMGTVVVPVFYLFFRRYAVPEFFLTAFFTLAVFAWCVTTANKILASKVNFHVLYTESLAGISLLFLIVVLLHLSHFTDVRLLAEGFMIRSIYLTETVFHQGIVNAISHVWPPPAIYASGGSDLSFYHLNMHLEIELVGRLSSIKSLYLVYFYMPFLYFLLLVSVPFLFVRHIGGTCLLGVITSALIFGTGFSYVPGMVGIFNPAYPWTSFFTTTIWSLFTLNGYIPALVALFLCIWVLNDFYKEGSKMNLILILLLAYGGFGFKSSMGVQIAGVCLLTGLLMVTSKPDRKNGLSLMIASVVILSLIIFDLFLFRSGIGNNIITLAPFNVFFSALNEQGLSDLPKLSYPILFILSLIGAFGVRALGLLFFKKIAWEKNRVNWTVVFLLIFVLSGYVISEFVFLGDPQRINTSGMNNAKWFFTQSLMGAWFLLFIFLVQWENRWKKSPLLSLVILGAAAPSTIQFLHLRFDSSYVLYDADDLKVVEALSDVKPDAVVLHPLNKGYPALASNFAGKASVVNIFRTFISEADRLSERTIDVHRFFGVDTSPEVRSGILQKYGVNYIYCPPDLNSQLSQLPDLEVELSTSKWTLFKVDG